MSKYTPLWEHVRRDGRDFVTLTFADVEQIAGVPIDHSFLTVKNELGAYGFEVARISLQGETVSFAKITE